MRRRVLRDLLPFLGCCAVALVLGIRPGQDASWDLRNYHFYNPYAWLNGRLDVDIAPAQLQTWLSPLWDLGYYALVRSGVHSRVTTGILAMPAAAALFALVLVARRMFPAGSHAWALAAMVAIGASGAATSTVIGTTMSEWHVTALVMAAMWLVLVARDGHPRGLALLAVAGACGGAAAGLKLTAAPFALGLAAMVVLLPVRQRRASSLAALAAGGLAGFLIVFGPWGWEVYRRYGNPFFPLLNDIFRSPFVLDASYRDPRFGGNGLAFVVTLPLRLLTETTGLVSEGSLREPRLALGLAALVFLSTWPRGAEPDARRRWRAILGFFVVSYAAWASVFGYLRYAGALELVASAAAVAALTSLLPPRRELQIAGAAALAAVVVAATARVGTPRARHGRPAVLAQVPPIAEDAMVVTATLDPVGYVVPSLPPGVPVISLVNNFIGHDPRPPRLLEVALARVHDQRGPLLLLTNRASEPEHEAAVTRLAAVGLRPALDRCAPIRTALDTGLALCVVEKVAQPSAAR